MNVILSAETQELLEQKMATGRFANPDELVRTALQQLDNVALDYDDLDADTRAAIEEAEAQYQRGEGRPWEELREQMRSRFGSAATRKGDRL